MNTAFAASKEDPLAGVADVKHDANSKAGSIRAGSMTAVEHMHNHRRLTTRQISLLSIAGTIGELPAVWAFRGQIRT